MTTFPIHTSGAKRAFAVAAAAAALFISAGVAVADQNGDHRQGGWGQDQGAAHHWQSGERMGQNDWNGAQPVDYRAHHLRHPPRGYEWRQSNGQYVLAAVAGGLVASAILSSGH